MHHISVLLASALAFSSVSASPAGHIFGRSVGDMCTGDEGTGTCQATANCKGISYPKGYCPHDPEDIQCCVEISCKHDTGFCRSVSDNGCPGGSFERGWCPGPSDIRCCIKDSSTPAPPSPPTSPPPAGGSLPGLNSVQSKHARVIISRVKALGMPKRACLVAIATAQQESTIRVLANTGVPESYNYPHDGEGSDHDSVGIFQQRPGWGTVKDRMDPAKSADKFLNALNRVDGWENWSIARAAQKVQVSAFPDAYAKWESLATKVCDAGF